MSRLERYNRLIDNLLPLAETYSDGTIVVRPATSNHPTSDHLDMARHLQGWPFGTWELAGYQVPSSVYSVTTPAASILENPHITPKPDASPVCIAKVPVREILERAGRLDDAPEKIELGRFFVGDGEESCLVEQAGFGLAPAWAAPMLRISDTTQKKREPYLLAMRPANYTEPEVRYRPAGGAHVIDRNYGGVVFRFSKKEKLLDLGICMLDGGAVYPGIKKTKAEEWAPMGMDYLLAVALPNDSNV